MAKQSNVAPIKQTGNASPFEIEDSVPVPPRTKDINDHGLLAKFEQMKEGQSLVIPFNILRVEEARTLVQRFGRDAKVNMTTRTEKSADGKTNIGLRVWKGGAKTAAEQAAE